MDQVNDLLSSEKAILFLSFHFIEMNNLLEPGIINDFVQSSNTSKSGIRIPFIDDENSK